MLQLLRHLRSSSASLKNPSTWFGSRSHGRISDCSMSGGSSLKPFRPVSENARESHSSLSFHDLGSRIKTRTMPIRGNFVYWHWRELPQPRTQCERNGRAHNFLRASSDFLPQCHRIHAERIRTTPGERARQHAGRLGAHHRPGSSSTRRRSRVQRCFAHFQKSTDASAPARGNRGLDGTDRFEPVDAHGWNVYARRSSR